MNINKNLKNEYEGRINRVFDYIDKNIATNLTLKSISSIAFYSPYHFHRVFKFIAGETLNEYITRQRVEKSASDIINGNLGMTEISQKYGFRDRSTFTRTFKKYYGISPTKFRKSNPHKFSKIRQIDSKNERLHNLK